MLIFRGFIQVFVVTTNHHLKFWRNRHTDLDLPDLLTVSVLLLRKDSGDNLEIISIFLHKNIWCAPS